jgi:peptidoglycan/xylan/chitin deacetylase (PgdA/CDA1 family)
MISRREFLVSAYSVRLRAQSAGFSWPKGKRAAVSLTFDDARPSQIDVGIPLLDRHKIKATFYVSLNNLDKRLADWKAVAAGRGHEIGNHSASHACTANYKFSRSSALEDFTRQRMEADIDRATEQIRERLGVTPVSFAYPCGQKFIGRGEGAQSYVPLVARRFISGRGYLDESANDPERCDLASLMGTGFDALDFDAMRAVTAAAATEGRWVVFVGHDIGAPARQTVSVEDLDRLCRYLLDPANAIWVDTVGTVSRYVREARVRS